MIDASIPILQRDANPGPFRFRTRLFIYIAVWFLAVLALEIFLPIEGLTETDETPFQQIIRLPLYAPIIAVLGLAQAIAWPGVNGWAFLAAFLCFALQAGFALASFRRLPFLALTCMQALLLAVSVIYAVRFAHQPTGG